MLRCKDGWKDLCDRERVVLLAIALELRQASGLEVRSEDVLKISGLREDQFGRAVRILEVKDLVEIKNPSGSSLCTWLSLTGDALTYSLGGEKAA